LEKENYHLKQVKILHFLRKRDQEHFSF